MSHRKFRFSHDFPGFPIIPGLKTIEHKETFINVVRFFGGRGVLNDPIKLD